MSEIPVLKQKVGDDWDLLAWHTEYGFGLGGFGDIPFGSATPRVPLRLTIDVESGRKLTIRESVEDFFDNKLEAEDMLQLLYGGKVLFEGRVLDPKGECVQGESRLVYTAEGMKSLLSDIVYRSPNTATGALKVVFNAPRNAFDYNEDRYDLTVGQIVREILTTMASDIRTALGNSSSPFYTDNLELLNVIPPSMGFSADTVKSALDKALQFQPEFRWEVDPHTRKIRFIGRDEAESKLVQVSLLQSPYVDDGFGENGFGDVPFGSPSGYVVPAGVGGLRINESTRMCVTAVLLQGDDESEVIAEWDPDNPSGSTIEPDWNTGWEDSWTQKLAMTEGAGASYGRVFRYFRLKRGTSIFPENARVLPYRAFGQENIALTHWSMYLGNDDDYDNPVTFTITPDGHIRLDRPIWKYKDTGDPSLGFMSKNLLIRFARLNSASVDMIVRKPSSGYEGTAYSLRGKERTFAWYHAGWKLRRVYGTVMDSPPEYISISKWWQSNVLWDAQLGLPDWCDPVTGADPLNLLNWQAWVTVGGSTYRIIDYCRECLMLQGFTGVVAGTPYILTLRTDAGKIGTLAQAILNEYSDLRYLGCISFNYLNPGIDVDNTVRLMDAKGEYEDYMSARVYRIEYDFVREYTTVHLTKESEISADELARRLFRIDESRLFELEHFYYYGGGDKEGKDTVHGGGEDEPGAGAGGTNIWL